MDREPDSGDDLMNEITASDADEIENRENAMNVDIPGSHCEFFH